ncbi:GAF domain-containing protein [Cerasibacillus quisquiliarum]|uniref:GAF domain-containing protein n=1 Tax=Cerasibacillus quisquiliarum TaxID=227865 RepID=A0A511V2J2_9BACI|nr:GAF domain-containing protein [Cerasibacillus quisquiliarum]MBB5147369.1 GAF domain-containing protein [Cerasibacillus quisquiliarum]GEN32271.1 hypothetical protein CQU01_25090 [Cerasibacillus quisquiliarum]
MFQKINDTGSRVDNYEILIKQLDALIADERDEIANLANAAGLLNQFLNDINWVGFYIWKHNELVLGPFQGLPACIRIPYGKGVCGSAVANKETLNVPNVNHFPGHIVCDAASQSEIVIPIFVHGHIYGVLDIDSPILNRFDKTDQHYLETFVAVLSEALEKAHAI